MLKKLVISTAILLQSASFCFAQTSNPPTTAPANPHKAYDQKARDCKKQAAELGLIGDESRAFIAQCMKK